MMNYIVYETTNLINGKYYIGVHKQDGLDFDGYLGSGKILQNAILKSGEENFSRSILFNYVDRKSAYKKEAEIVNDNFIKSSNNYNIKPGGIGGFKRIAGKDHYNYGKKLTEKHKQALITSRKGKKNSAEHIKRIVEYSTGRKMSLEGRERIRQSRIGKKLSEETKNKMKKAHVGRIIPIVKCPYCGKEGKESGMKSWHFDYCKENPNKIQRKR